MKCFTCGKDVAVYLVSHDKTICGTCSELPFVCEVCNKIAPQLEMFNNKLTCGSCRTKIIHIQKLKSDPRIKQLAETPILPNKISNNEGLDDFAQIGNEALASALYLKNFEVLGVNPDSSLDGIRERIKELLLTWHPDLHKNDPEKHREAAQKVKEFKIAYDAIASEKERPYKALELKYGASHQELIQAYDFLKNIYNPINFTDNPELGEKVKQKNREITDAYEELLQSYKTSNSHQRQVKPASHIQLKQVSPQITPSPQTYISDKGVTGSRPPPIKENPNSQNTTSTSSNNKSNVEVLRLPRLELGEFRFVVKNQMVQGVREGEAFYNNCEVFFYKKAVVLVPVDRYSEVGVAGGIVLQLAAHAYNAVQAKKCGPNIIESDVPQLIEDGNATLIKGPCFTVYPCKKSDILDIIISFMDSVCRLEFSGIFVTGNSSKKGKAWINIGDSAKSTHKNLIQQGFRVELSSTSVPA